MPILVFFFVANLNLFANGETPAEGGPNVELLQLNVPALQPKTPPAVSHYQLTALNGARRRAQVSYSKLETMARELKNDLLALIILYNQVDSGQASLMNYCTRVRALAEKARSAGDLVFSFAIHNPSLVGLVNQEGLLRSVGIRPRSGGRHFNGNDDDMDVLYQVEARINSPGNDIQTDLYRAQLVCENENSQDNELWVYAEQNLKLSRDRLSAV